MSARSGNGLPASAWIGLCVVLAAGAVAARADIYNGDFEATPPLDGWMVSGSNPPGSYVETVPAHGSTVAHLHVESTYTYQSGQWIGAIEQAFIQQLMVTLQAGETHLRFDGSAVTAGQEVDDPTVTVTALGGGGGGRAVDSATWTTYLVPLVDSLGDPLAPGTSINLAVLAGANPPTTGGQEGQQVTQVVDLWVDNFRLVPGPAPALLLLAGTGAVLRRRRR